MKRRQVLASLGALALSPVIYSTPLKNLTPMQTTGPFYPESLPLDDDNDLTQVKGETQRAKGIWSDLSGRVIDINGQPLTSTRIEIWQCDINGRYRHPLDNAQRPLDPGFQGFGFTNTDARGEYRFRTIRPEQYPGRTPHIHVAVYPENQRPFTTQIYIAGDPRNETDFLYKRVPADRRQYLLAEFKPSQNNEVSLEAEFEIVLHTRQGTPQS